MSLHLGASHLNDPGWEIQRRNNFEISISGVGEANNLLTLSIVSGSLPNESNNPIEIAYGNSVVKVAGTYTIQSGNLVIRDFLDKDMEKVVEDWRALVYNKDTRAVGFAADYKKTARITQFAPDGTRIRSWIVKGVWPSSVQYGEVSQSDNSLKEISVTLEYDEAKIDRSEYKSPYQSSSNQQG